MASMKAGAVQDVSTYWALGEGYVFAKIRMRSIRPKAIVTLSLDLQLPYISTR
jgi:hypothetical protein